MAVRKFYLILTDEGEPSKVEEVVGMDNLKKRVKELYSDRDKLTSRQLFVIYGERWNITKGPFPYLIPPHGTVTGQSIPLFDGPAPDVTDDDGFLSKTDDELDSHYAKVTKSLMAPTTPKQPQEQPPDSPF